MTTSVLLADFQFLTRQGIVSIIESISGFQIIHQISEPSKLEETIDRLKPDLVVLDVSYEDHELVAALEKTKEKSDSKFLIISNTQNKQSVQKLLSMGIKGIVTKNCSKEEITNALTSVNQNNRFFCNKILHLVVEHQESRMDCEPTSLSSREYEILTLVAQGNTSNKIAEQLFLSIHTINSHRKNILKKLNVKSATELISYAIQSGIIKAY